MAETKQMSDTVTVSRDSLMQLVQACEPDLCPNDILDALGVPDDVGHHRPVCRQCFTPIRSETVQDTTDGLHREWRHVTPPDAGWGAHDADALVAW